jgi:diguanylate cyclase (GGDEF)-like protein/PAS domain S-box-containing protein
MRDAAARNEAIARNARDARDARAILEHVGLAILLTRDRHIYRCNPLAAELFGWSDEAALTGRPGRVLFASDDDYLNLTHRARRELFAGKIFSADVRLARFDGSSFTAHLTARAIVPEAPRDGTIWTIDDVSERRALEAHRQRLLREHQIIFDHALTGILFSRNRTVERCNRRLEEIFGYPNGSLIGSSTRVLFGSDETYEETGQRVYAAIAAGGRFQGEAEYMRADGSTVWCQILGSMVDPAAPEQGFVWIYEDITSRKAAEAAVAESRRALEQRVVERTAELSAQLLFLEQLIEAIPGPVFYNDAAGRYLGCNTAFERYVGMPKADLVGRSVRDVSPLEFAERNDAADRALLDQPGNQIYEARVSYADGSEHDVMFHKATFRHPSGEIAGIVGVILDISDRKRMEERLHLAATVFNSTADGVTITDPSGAIIAVNRAFTEITGYSESDVIGANPRLLKSNLHDAAFYQGMWKDIRSVGFWRGEIWNRRRDGSIYPEALTITAVCDDSGRTTHFVAVFSDITRIKGAQEALDFQAHHDPLTGLPNRLLLEDRIDKAVQRAKRSEQQLGLLFVDLDRFKNVNDTLGHHVGDLVLCEVARRFTAAMREADTVARLGGDEFVILVENIPEAAAASRIADKLLADLQRPISLEMQDFFIGASIGISLFPSDGDDRSSLLKHADAAMYRAKERGRNTYEFFTNELTNFSLERFQLEADIRYALERDELRVWFQPQFDLRDNSLIGAEALLRWEHPGRGMVAPGVFIPIAEESGLIVPIGEWILRHACQCWADWHAAGHRPGRVSVNVSGIEFRRGRVMESVEMTLAATRLPPELIELEITESSIMNQTENSIQKLHQLRAMGLHLAIDDFGTGYSSLAYLKRLPINKLKVDKSFVRDLPDDAEDAAITRAIIALGHSLGLTLIAEGVENQAQRDFLHREGCDQLQGYLMGRPVPAEEFARLYLAPRSHRSD